MPSVRARRFLLQALLLFAALALPALAQCTPQWQPGDPMRNVHGTVYTSVTWDPDGAGPAAPVLVVGGTFAVASFQGNVATFDGTQWTQLPNVPGPYVRALGVYANELVAASPDPAVPGNSRVWRWNGSAWTPLGMTGSVNGDVTTMIAYSGWLVIGGVFSSVDGHTSSNIAKWDGTTWTVVGVGFITGVVGSVKAFAVFNGELHVAGNISQAGGISLNHHAVWNGGAWSPGGFFNAPIETLSVRTGISPASNYLFVGGSFTTVFNQQSGTVAALHVARMQQTTGMWSAVGAGLAGTKCTRVCVRATSLFGYEVMASVDNTPSTTWQWNNSTQTWTNYGTVEDSAGLSEVTTLSLFNNQYVLGLFAADSAMRTLGPQGWATPLAGQGFDGRVLAQCRAGGDLVIGGLFRTISGVTVNGIARGHANSWQPLGSGVDYTFSDYGVYALATMPNGDIVAAGRFLAMGGVPAPGIARWNGVTWAPMGTGLALEVYALCVMPNGDLIAGGSFHIPVGTTGTFTNGIARWDGTTWLPCGNADDDVYCLAVMPNGDLIAGGDFSTIGNAFVNRIARLSGGVWSPLGTGLGGSVMSLAVQQNGDVFASGLFGSVNGNPTPNCARFDGTAWQSLRGPGFNPTNIPGCLVALPDGDVAAGGSEWTYTSSFPPANIRTNLARLHISGGVPVWSSLDVHGAAVTSASQGPDGTLSIVGDFDIVGSQFSGNVARLVPPCSPLASSSGVGCSGRTLTAATLPWVNATFRAKGTNLPTTAVVLTVTSVSPVPQGLAPLASIFAQGQPGCDVLVAPDILGAVVTTNGTAESSLFLPNTPPLVGVTFFHQMIPIAVDAQGAWTSVTATNALQLTAGIF